MERRSDADFALHEQLAAVPLHHLMRDGESESGAVALRREERLENVSQYFGRHSRSGVADPEMRELLRVAHDAERKDFRFQFAAHADLEHAAARHRVTGIDDELREDPMQLIRVAEYVPDL